MKMKHERGESVDYSQLGVSVVDLVVARGRALLRLSLTD